MPCALQNVAVGKAQNLYWEGFGIPLFAVKMGKEKN